MAKSRCGMVQAIGIALRIEVPIFTAKQRRREVVVGLNAATLGGAQSRRGRRVSAELRRNYLTLFALGSEVFRCRNHQLASNTMAHFTRFKLPPTTENPQLSTRMRQPRDYRLL